MKKYTVKLEGFGGELNVGKLDPESAKNLKKKAKGNYDVFVRDENQMANLGLNTYSQISNVISLNNITTNCKITILDNKNNTIFDGEYSDLETDYYGDYNQESIIAVSENQEDHEFATLIIDTPILYSFSGEEGIFFNSTIEIPSGEDFELNELALVINEVKINTDKSTVFGYDFITEVRYKDNLFENLKTETTPLSFEAKLIEP